MQQESKIKKTAVVFWILTVIVMGLIFFFSAQTKDESSMQSNFIYEIFVRIFGEGAVTEFIVRKIAHFSEFALLCFLFNFSFYYTFDKPKRILSVVLASAYAATDEFHQLFVEGRACQFTDWVIDTCGALFGLLAFAIIVIFFCKQKSDIISAKKPKQ